MLGVMGVAPRRGLLPAGWEEDAQAWAFAAGGGDVTAPVLSSPTDSASGSSLGIGAVSTDEGNGTLWWVVTQSATSPSVVQIQAGQNHLGAAADANGSQAVTTTGTQNVSASGLTAETAYYFHFQQEDAATNDSTVVSADGFTTGAVIATDGAPSSRSCHRFTNHRFGP